MGPLPWWYLRSQFPKSHHPSRVIAAIVLALAFTSTAGASTERILHNFVITPYGEHPSAPLIEDSAGNLYGTTATGGLHTFGVVFELTHGANGSWSQKVLYNFAGAPDGSSPVGRLVLDSTGNLYGTTQTGGRFNCGTAYKLTPSSSGPWKETVLHSFCTNSLEGAFPSAGLIFDKAGNLYGTNSYSTYYSIGGTAFELSPLADGSWSEKVLYNFTRSAGGYYPLSELLFDPAGNLYGTTSYGGEIDCNDIGHYLGCGTVFKLSPSSEGTWTESVLYTFEAGPPSGRLLIDTKGDLYGTAYGGVVFALHRSGQGNWTYTEIQNSPNGIFGDLAFDSAGNIYGLGPVGNNVCGNQNCGAVLELQKSGTSWSLLRVYSFPTMASPLFPCCGLTIDSAGNIFGVTQASSDQHDYGTVFELTPSSSGTLQGNFLYQFPQVDGDYPVGELIADAAGNLYGVTEHAGRNTTCNWATSCGVVFRLTPLEGGSWKYDILYDFSMSSHVGEGPQAGLALDPAGYLYGTTEWGGKRGEGTVFKLTPSATGAWELSTLYSFGEFAGDGIRPLGKLIVDAAGNLYGTTFEGGSARSYGTVFQLSPQPDGTYKEIQLYAFGFGKNFGTDGEYPEAGLVMDGAGNLYGTTFEGGETLNCGYGCGVVFKLSPNANGTWMESVIHTFVAGSDGYEPVAGLILDSQGNLYGTTTAGGTFLDGVVFELSPTGSGAWMESILYSFQGGATDGYYPSSNLSFDAVGNLYGTTLYGGLKNCVAKSITCGTLFELTPTSGGTWRESIVHLFGNGFADGNWPVSGVLVNSNGHLFGMTSSGPGDNAGGTVFEITP